MCGAILAQLAAAVLGNREGQEEQQHDSLSNAAWRCSNAPQRIGKHFKQSEATQRSGKRIDASILHHFLPARLTVKQTRRIRNSLVRFENKAKHK